eukprot:Blabericola_migrator_1__1741@NODE_146_length_12961_cov_103_787110_g127_i0_p5_GENE_NODE_146_length_12961_cov_103_787110_g127_i0NODE_146_length_12961_cov_103_787110_g127_i0_p5_ORF_typecomplete_len207_score11_37_NODE_146_length_12961_cov_103_787110_g127_i056166236
MICLLISLLCGAMATSGAYIASSDQIEGSISLTYVGLIGHVQSHRSNVSCESQCDDTHNLFPENHALGAIAHFDPKRLASNPTSLSLSVLRHAPDAGGFTSELPKGNDNLYRGSQAFSTQPCDTPKNSLMSHKQEDSIHSYHSHEVGASIAACHGDRQQLIASIGSELLSDTHNFDLDYDPTDCASGMEFLVTGSGLIVLTWVIFC